MSTETGSGGVKRRDFLKIVGATGAATAVVGCTSEKVGKLIPYVVSPDETVPGVSNYFATVCRECGGPCGVLAEVRDGRVIKLEGNPNHPGNRGALTARCQSAVQGLYNPDRYRAPLKRVGGRLQATTWADALGILAQRLGQVRSQGTAGTAVFINQHELGSFPAFLDQWLAGYGMPAHLSWNAEAPQAVISANRAAFGGSAWPRLDFSRARLVLSFGADFLDGWGSSAAHQLDWADARAKLADAPRMIYIGPRRSLTGLNADEWIPVKPGSELAVANMLRGQMPAAQAAQATGVDQAVLTRLAQEVTAAGGAVLAIAGATSANAGELATAVNAMNAGGLAAADPTMNGAARLATFADVRGVAERLNAGQVSMFFVRGANPAYETPKSLGFAAALAKASNTFKVSFTSYPDETSELCDLVLPDHHPLESWGDAEAGAGMIALQQPAMEPVFDTRQTADVLIALARADQASAARYPQATYREWLMGRFPGGAAGWTAAAPKGVVAGSVLASTAPARPAPTAVRALQGGIEATQGDFYLVLYPSPLLGHGAGANKPWLQELSDPVTKLSWQSWAEIHPMKAKQMGVENGDHLTIQTAAGSITVPAYIYPGVRPDTIAVPLGQGHTAYGRYARAVGVNALDALPVSEDAAGGLVLTATKARVSKAAGHSALVTTEGSARQHGRGIGQAIAVTELGAVAAPGGERAGAIAPQSGGPNTTVPGAGQQGAGEGAGEEHIPGEAKSHFLPGLRSPVAADAQGDYADPTSKDHGMYDPNHPTGMAKRRWAMTIDLARCTGCSACVTACYAENNLPTVGAPWQGRALAPGVWDETPGANIIKGREMTWIRLERYYEGAWNVENAFEPDFDTRFVPMLCQHCGNAPCEPVCPVFATYHSPDGLNVQVYNRCVGTRYCSNNCPYKVRYFNWFGYGEPSRRQYAFPEPLHWQLNPDVTVRGKGVMEKCTFCVQRIREAENRAKLENRSLEADEFTTACAQACPSRAITFGDAADPKWTVAQLANDRRAYHVFEELNTYTAVVYLKKVTHPAPGAPVA
ncbi:molybdopterin dinucleotide-binding region [Gemmatirosa kalamazoonensis]|uniref:Molybdopterin dinucleotide-binding region n=1 Tax=Gemmatirosa kalamazoonensis TaxID=861299 RepID=W0RL52_9BACT|nr:molybdopterin-dependent oxidoreductase [Gemmatirosa kalamazoonensis]AHG91167.1 molybdopterin dinucleotide-binding region [Gemmatirosa kalamazoonensis]